MENETEATIMENQMEKNMENEMETGRGNTSLLYYTRVYIGVILIMAAAVSRLFASSNPWRFFKHVELRQSPQTFDDIISIVLLGVGGLGCTLGKQAFRCQGLKGGEQQKLVGFFPPACSSLKAFLAEETHLRPFLGWVVHDIAMV